MALNSAETNKKSWSRRQRNIRFSISASARKFMYIVGVVLVVFLIRWQYRASIGHGSYEISISSTVKIDDEMFRNFTFLTFEHVQKLKSGFGLEITIEYSDGLDAEHRIENGITLNITKPLFPKKIEFTRPIYLASQKTVGYVRVSRYREQMTMSLRALIALAGQAKMANRKVLAPTVENSSFGTNGSSLETYFNVTHFNNVLALSDYATLVDEEEYEAECSLADASHVAIYFLYEHDEERTTQLLNLNKKRYDDISDQAGKIGWTKCPPLENAIEENSNTKYFCVNVSKVTEWGILEDKVIKGAKCLTIFNWRGIGSSFRTNFTQKHLNVNTKDVQFALKPSRHILNEVNRFRRAFYDRYIAVHFRGEKIFLAHNFFRLRRCLRVLAELVKALKAVSDMTQVLIASDTSRFGSGSWNSSLKGHQERETLKDLHSFLISSIGAIEYIPTADNLDRGVVALVEMTLLARAQHLITVGKGSFQEWIKAKFLEYHRDDDLPSWSLVTMCSK